ncbi:hypothetical protein P3X46_022531, partial [Hevea brasiliensis]
NTIPRRDEAREGPGETSQPQEEGQGRMFEESPVRVPPYTPPPTDPVLAYLQRMETTIYGRMRAIEDSLQEAHNKLDMLMDKLDEEDEEEEEPGSPSSSSEGF